MKEPTSTADRSAASAAATLLPVLPPPAALIEIAVLFSLMVFGDWLHPGMELADIRPHPFWIPVLLLSLQYGTVSGMIAAAVAIGLTVLSGFPEQGPSETYFNYLLKIWIEPILWIGAAVLIGQFRMRQIGRKQELILQVQELSSQRAAIADYARNLRAHCTALERQIAGRPDGNPLRILQALHDAHDAMAMRGDSEIGPAFSRLLAVALPGSRATLYVADSDGLNLVAAIGKPVAEAEHAAVPAADQLYRTIVAEASAVSVLSREGEQRLATRGVAGVPILAPAGSTAAGRRVVGMLKLEDVPPSALDDTLLPALIAVGGVFAPALQARASGIPALAPAALVLTPSQKLWRHLRWFRGQETGTPESPPIRKASTVTR